MAALIAIIPDQTRSDSSASCPHHQHSTRDTVLTALEPSNYAVYKNGSWEDETPSFHLKPTFRLGRPIMRSLQHTDRSCPALPLPNTPPTRPGKDSIMIKANPRPLVLLAVDGPNSRAEHCCA